MRRSQPDLIFCLEAEAAPAPRRQSSTREQLAFGFAATPDPKTRGPITDDSDLPLFASSAECPHCGSEAIGELAFGSRDCWGCGAAIPGDLL